MQGIADVQISTPVETLYGRAVRGEKVASPRVEAWRQRLVNLTLVLSDVVLALVVWEIACVIQMFWAPGYLDAWAVASIVPVALVWVGLRAAHGLYPGYGLDAAQELRRETYALLVTLAVAAVFALAFQVGDAISRFLLLLVFAGLLFLAPLVRQATKRWMLRHDVWGKPVAILGSGDAGEALEAMMLEKWWLGFLPAEVHRTRPELYGESAGYAHSLERVANAARRNRLDTLFLAMPHARQGHLTEVANRAGLHFRRVVIIPDLAGISSAAVTARSLAGTVGLEVRYNLLCPGVRRAKRALDVALTVVGGLAILPIFLALCAVVRLESRGPVFYSATRMGRDDRPFRCIKFRTMVPDAEEALARLLAEDPEAREEYRRYHKLRRDPRVTRVGRFLRKTSLDELPQLLNVLRGEMSLVGPRPYLPRESAEIGETQGEILRVYPGITGPWQVEGRSGTSFEDRVQIDAVYVRDWSIWTDLVILARTVGCVLFNRGAY